MTDSTGTPLPLDPGSFLESSPILSLAIGAKTGRVLWMRGGDDAPFGHSRDRWLQEGFWASVLRPADLTDVLASRAQGVAEGARIDIDYQMIRADGAAVWVNEIGTAFLREDGEREIRCHLIDISDRKRQELALWKSEEWLRALLRKSPDALLLTDTKGTILNMNDQAEALFGYDMSEIAGSSIEHLVTGASRLQLAALIEAFDRDPDRRSIIDGRVVTIERSDAAKIPVEISKSLLVTPDGERQILCSVRDLTARRRVEAQLRSSQRHLRQIANALPAMVCFLDTEHRFVFVNDAYTTAAGLDRSQVEGRALRKLLGDSLYRQLEPAVEEAAKGNASHVRGEMPVPGGSVPADITLAPHRDEGDAVSGYFLVILDRSMEVAAREADRRHRAELAHFNRVATLGELAASIAHELNQPLSAIVANAQAARRFLDTTTPKIEEVSVALEDIASSSMRAGEVINSMRDLLERDEKRHDPVEVFALARDVVTLLHSEAIGRGVVVKLVEPADGHTNPFVSGDVIQLKQVLINLVVNAIEAAASSEDVDRRVVLDVRDDESAIRIDVADSGPGLPVADPEELFRPFFSRREGGLGMGLAISRTIAAAHRGTLVGRGRPEGGSVFTLELPRG